MATNTRISNAAAKAALDALVDLIDASSVGGYVEIRTGAPPTNVDDSATGTLLVTLDLPGTAFGAAADENPGAVATANAIDPVAATTTGTAGYFRAYDGDGLAIIQGTIGTSDADMIVTTTSVVASVDFEILSWVIRHPESGA